MNIALAKLKYSKVDQENVELCVQEWKKSRPGDYFFFRGYGQDVESKLEQKLLFVHQSKEQKRLMRKYGNHIGLLDATYKTTRYAIPLFFVVGKTNVDYQIAGSFSVHKETTEAIAEACPETMES